MNVLLITKENNGGGLVTHVINLANTLMKKGNEVTVIGPLVNEDKGRFDALECEFVSLSLSTKNPIEFSKNIRIINTIIKNKNIDIIHSHNRIASVYAQIISKQTGVPFVWTLHLNNIPANPISRALTFYGKKAIVVSSDIFTFCVDKLKIKREDVVVGYNGVYEEKYIPFSDDKKEEIKQKYNISENQKVVVLLSRLDPVKGHKKLINALDGLETNTDYAVLFTGESMVPGYKEELTSIVTKKNLNDHIKFVGYVDPVEILNISDLFVLPSDNEGFPISMIESLLLRVPVIMTKIGGYEDAKNFIMAMEGEEDLREYLRLFLDDKLETDNIVELGYQFAINNCTCDAMTNKVLSIYKEVLGK